MAEVLAEFRRQYPQYHDLTDAEVAANLIQDDPEKWTPLVGKHVVLSLGNRQSPFAGLQPPVTPGLGDPTAIKTTPGALALEGLRTAADIGLPAAGGAAGAMVPGGGLLTAGAGAAAGGYLARAMRGEFMPNPEATALDFFLGGMGAAPAKAGGVALARPDKLGREALKAAQSFRQPMRLSAAEQSGKSGMAQLEAYPGRFPIGSGKIRQFAERRHEDVGAALAEIGEGAGSTLAIDEAGAVVKKAVRATVERETQAAETASRDLIRAYAKPVERETLGGKWREAYFRASQARRAEASAKYEAAEAAVQGQVRPATNLRGAAQEVTKHAELLRGIAPSQPGAAGRGLVATTKGAEMPARWGDLTPEQATALMRAGANPDEPLQSLSAQFVQQFGLNEPREFTFSEMRALQSELSDRMAQAASDRQRRGLRELFDAVSGDLDTFQNPLIAEANRFYKKEVAALYGPRSSLRKLSDMTELDRIADKILAVDSPSRVRAIMAPLSVEEAQVYRATFLETIHDAGINVTPGLWEPAKYLRATARYSDDTIKTLLGPTGFSRYAQVRADARAAVARVGDDLTTSRILHADDAKVLDVLVRNNATQDVKRMMATLDEPTQAAARAGKWQEMIGAASDKQTGDLSLERLRTQLGNIDVATRREFFGDPMAGRITDLQRVLQRIGHAGGMSRNPAETARGLGGMSQIQGIFRLSALGGAGMLGYGASGGGVPGALVGATVLLSPSLVARLVTSERGIKLLTQGLITKPRTVIAARILGELAAFGAKRAAQDEP